MSKILYELGGWLWWIFCPSDLHEKLGGGSFIFTPTWGNHPIWLIFFPKDLLRMVSWNPNTLRFVSVIFHSQNAHPLTFGEPGSLGVSNGLVQAPPRTETYGSCGRQRKDPCDENFQAPFIRKWENHLWCSSSWRCLLTSYFNQNVEKPRWYFIFAAEASLVLRLSSGSYATPGLLLRSGIGSLI